MPETVQSLQLELAKLMKQITDARSSGDEALADVLTEAAASCLVKLANAQLTTTTLVPHAHQSNQPVAQQQQQIQPDKDDDLKT